MSNEFESDGRGPSATQLLVTGICCLAVAAGTVTAMIANSRGAFRDMVTVTAIMANVGDGLPPKSDVKFQGIRVGLVSGVEPTPEPGMNVVRIQLGPEYAGRIPDTVTARVVPSNIFAVPSVQLVDNGSAQPLRTGAQIAQDRSLSTVRLQTSLDQLRRVVAAVGRDQADTAVGMLATLAKATNGQGDSIAAAAAQLRDIVASLRGVVSADAAPSTLDSLSGALREVQAAAPDLLDALHHAVVPMLTLAQQNAQLTALLSGGVHTFTTADEALEHNTDRVLDITTHISPVMATLGDGASTFPQITRSVTHLVRLVANEAWDPKTQRMSTAAIVQLTPNRQYTRADCPRYGELAAPSCQTGPTSSADSPAVPSSLDPRAFQPPSSLVGPNIGPVGSPEEQRKIAEILGGLPNSAADILFGPLARGTTVSVAPDPAGGGK
ncbi:MCE family protein [Nocardia sp. NBC_00565]|uniref:MlaD family protein n=1 Tax=Nocardia sp. NBC_00565 TaxID=2975993 RepID=UPI002E7FED08|nr:MCE family protein [Nocardia sp. NBC_00565]WUC01927.1 MCE family protein [Nocardia sp. NBC_00565]